MHLNPFKHGESDRFRNHVLFLLSRGLAPPMPEPALSPKRWQFLGISTDKRPQMAKTDTGKIVRIANRDVKVFTYCEHSRYDGEALRAIRKKNGVGRPPKNRRLH